MIVDQRVCKTTLTSVKDFKGRKKRDVIWAVFEDAFSNNLQLTGPDDYAGPGEGPSEHFPRSMRLRSMSSATCILQRTLNINSAAVS